MMDGSPANLKLFQRRASVQTVVKMVIFVKMACFQSAKMVPKALKSRDFQVLR